MIRMVGLGGFPKGYRFLRKIERLPLDRYGRYASNEGPAYIVRQKIMQGQMKSDFKQTAVVEGLQGVYEDIRHYSPGKILSGRTPRGLYIYGSVGAGKTMLMDIFYNSINIRAKRRSHFNNFMADVHSRIHQLKKKKKGSKHFWGKAQHSDVITPVAVQLVKEAWLLCFDEFQVTDIADAMILKGLFTEMFHNGMVMVATSNRAPDDLYKNGLQRSNFLPFIPILKQHCKLASISGKDYRVAGSEGIQMRYLITEGQKTKSEMEAAFKHLCKVENQRAGSKTLNILGHKVTFRNTCGRILFVSFKELCDKPLSSADYIQIAEHFDTILIKDIPMMNMSSRNQARRFILLIDTLYDKKIRVMLSAAGPPKSLFSGLANDSPTTRSDRERLLMDDLNIEGESENARSSLFSGSEEVFAFERTVSRITEMCSMSYWNRYQR